MTPRKQDPLASLVRLGFSELEAMVYLDLLHSPNSTGYAIGKSINKPHANVYQSLVALENKGAVFSEGGSKKTFTAVPPPELIDQMRSRSEKEFEAVSAALSSLDVAESEEDRFYHLTTREQVFARARSLLREAEGTVMIESHPSLIDELREDLQEAVGRGVVVAGLVMSEASLIEGTKLVVSHNSEQLMKVWPADHIALVVDGRQILLALMGQENGQVRRAVWMASTYVASILHNGLVADAILHNDPVLGKIKSQNRFLLGRLPSGFEELLSQ